MEKSSRNVTFKPESEIKEHIFVLSDSADEYDSDTEYDMTEDGGVPLPPPPTRNTSAGELSMHDDDFDDSMIDIEDIDDDDDSHISPTPSNLFSRTPPPSLNRSTTDLSDVNPDIINIVGDENIDTQPPFSPERKPRKHMRSSRKAMMMSDEVAAAVSLSLGCKGYTIYSDNIEDD